MLTYRPDIDGLRALAVVSVVLFHAFPAHVPNGFFGVDVFFVISGFVITGSMIRDRSNGVFSIRSFYTRRIIRIFPALCVVVAACIAFGWIALLADEYMQLAKHAAAASIFAANAVFAWEAGYFDPAALSKPLLHLWSLAIEEQFYILWPFAIALAWRRRWPLLVSISTLATASFIFAVLATNSGTSVFFNPLARAWELACGCGLAVAMQNSLLARMSEAGRLVLSLLGCGLLVVSLAAPFQWGFHPGTGTILPVVGTLLVIAAGPATLFNARLLGHPAAAGLGLISYPLYLWHWPLLSFSAIVLSEMPPRGVRIVVCAVAGLLAWLTYRFVEVPIRQWDRQTTVLSLFISFTAIGLVSVSIYLAEGLDQRAMIKNLANNKNELLRAPAIDDGCLARIGLDNPLFPYCRFSNQGGVQTVAIIGDSHAHVAFPGIAEHLATLGINTLMLANSGCPLLSGHPIGNSASERVACEQRTRQILDIIASHDDIKMVFIFSRGPAYLADNAQVVPSTGQVKLADLPPEKFAEGLQRTISLLFARNKQVHYVLENPNLAYSAASCITRPFNFARNDCRQDKQAVLSQQSAYRKAVDKLHSVKVIDSLDAFCPSELCMVFDGNTLLYADKDHLSAAGSRFQVRQLLRTYLDAMVR